MLGVINTFLYYSMLALGSVFLSVAIVVPKKLIFLNPKKYKVINKKEYIRSQRKLFSKIGISYISFGGMLIFKILSLNLAQVFMASLPVILLIFNSKINKKYLLKLD